MKIKNLIGKAAMAMAIAISLSAVSAHAARGQNNQRDVIGDALSSCWFLEYYQPPALLPDDATNPEIKDFACGVLWKTEGDQIKGRGCPAYDAVYDAADGYPYLEYSGRNCDRNQEALQRKISSTIISLDDLIVRLKSNQRATAASYACDYASKVHELVGADKLDQNPGADVEGSAADAEDQAADAEDLAADAEDIAFALVGEDCP